jgi:uncharacterized protein
MTTFRGWIPFCLALALWAPMASSLRAASTTVVISEFRVRGPAGGSDEFIELHNRSSAPVNIGGWTIRGSNATGGVSVRLTITTGTVLNPGCFFLATNSSTSGGPYSGTVPGNQTYATGITDDGGIAVAMADGTLVDQVGMSAGSAYKEGTPLASLGSTNVNRGYERKPGGPSGHGTDTDNNSSDFQILAPSQPQNLSSPCIVTGALGITGSATPQPATRFEPVLIMGVVTPALDPASTSLAASADLSALGGSSTQMLYDDGSNGDTVAFDMTFSFELPSVTAAPGQHSVTVGVTDGEQRSHSDSFVVQVVPPPTIYLPHDVQGFGTVSPLVTQSVTVEGVITGRRSNGVFLQTARGREDAYPETSEGLFVFTGATPGPPVAITPGVLVRATGTVTEFSGDTSGLTLTQLSGSPTFTVLGSDPADFPEPTPLTLTMLTPDGGVDQLEPLEGMLVAIESLTTSSGTQGSFASATGGEAAGIATSNGVFFAVLSGTPRPVREPGLDLPLAGALATECASGPPCNIPVFDSNPERLRVDSDALGAPAMDVTSGVVITGMTGVIDSGFLTWGLLPVPSAPGIAGPNAAGTGVSAAGPTQFTVASFNLQRFYDTVNDPGGDVPLTPENYARRLAKASLGIRTALRLPDIVAVQEVEKLEALQDLAQQVNLDSGRPGEYSAYLEEGNDPGGIDVGFLVRSRVRVTSVVQVGKDATFVNPVSGAPDLLNDRPPLVMRATVLGPLDRVDANLIVVVNHLRSLNDAATSPRVRAKRQKQAEFLAELLDALQDEAPVVSVGDYNAFEFSDGLVDVLGTVIGNPAPADQVVVSSPDLTEPDFVVAAPGVYSYVFDGNTQTLDHVLMSSGATSMFAGLDHARINADFPEVYRNDPSRMERVSDHDPAVAYFEFPLDTIPPDVAAVPSVASLWPVNHLMIPVEVAITATDNRGIASCGIAHVSSSEPVDGLGDGNTAADWIIDGPTSLQLRAERSGRGPGRVYTVTVACTDFAGNTTTADTYVTVAPNQGK